MNKNISRIRDVLDFEKKSFLIAKKTMKEKMPF